MNILVAVADLGDAEKCRINSALEGHTVVYRESLGDDLARQAAVMAAEVIFGNVPASWLVPTQKLRWVQLDSAGFDAYLKTNDKRAAGPILFTNLRDFYGLAVAESALAGILAFYRQLPRLIAAQGEARWIKREIEHDIRQLHSARVIILGAGAIGRAFERLLQPFDCEIRYFARTAPESILRTRDALDASLGSADIVINTLPHTADTIGLLDRARLGRFQSTALLVNVGRGSVLDEAAMVAALDARQLGGAILDVTQLEPLPADSLLWAHPRVLLTQHTGGRFPGEAAAKVTRFIDNFGRFTRAEPLAGLADLGRGY
jgi:glyoxylate/hydroxypyruvate reductase A